MTKLADAYDLIAEGFATAAIRQKPTAAWVKAHAIR
jgi:hypothetical protein